MTADRRPSDSWLVTATVALVALGMLNMISTGMSSLAVRHAAIAAVGLGAMWATSRMRIATLSRVGWALFTASVVLLAAVPLIGIATKGAQRWLNLGVFTLQPSEIAKLALVLVPAAILAGGYTLGRFVGVLVVSALPIALVALQPDLSTAVVLVATVLLMLILTRVPLRSLFPLFALGLASLPLAVLFLRPYQLERIHVFLSG
ncbi:FtsW/RodA/SpoVE family cell cycle protein, partial [Rhodococcus sp. R1101]|uniref:FtsW/RodA/SpoVE family cell cycle protein n=1 Tax=Rhodococcus sp. R1101 TaxID=1170698 RepID=UPI0003707609